VFIGELHQSGVALGRGVHGDLIEDTTGGRVDRGRWVGVDMGVDADDDIDHLAKIGQTGHAFSPSPEVGRGSGPGQRFGRTVMRHARRR
jgi:hypothetical protein